MRNSKAAINFCSRKLDLFFHQGSMVKLIRGQLHRTTHADQQNHFDKLDESQRQGPNDQVTPTVLYRYHSMNFRQVPAQALFLSSPTPISPLSVRRYVDEDTILRSTKHEPGRPFFHTPKAYSQHLRKNSVRPKICYSRRSATASTHLPSTSSPFRPRCIAARLEYIGKSNHWCMGRIWLWPVPIVNRDGQHYVIHLVPRLFASGRESEFLALLFKLHTLLLL